VVGIQWNVVFGISGMVVNTNKIGPASVSAPHTFSSNELTRLEEVVEVRFLNRKNETECQK
jgi:hypothetical protein